MSSKDNDHNQKNKGLADKMTGPVAMESPPLKPFSNKGSHAPRKPPGLRTFSGTASPGVVNLPNLPRPHGRPLRVDGDSKILIVGRDIRLNGEITSCDKLVVEGEVEAPLTEARVIEVTPTGYFKGAAQVDEADISGRYEGELTARNRLIVRPMGHISGSIRYGSIVIEPGGQISGDISSLAATGGDAPKEMAEKSPNEPKSE